MHHITATSRPGTAAAAPRISLPAPAPILTAMAPDVAAPPGEAPRTGDGARAAFQTRRCVLTPRRTEAAHVS